ncbi:MAG: bifunctional sugar-1-phosphate nucleotidylyltransferase/acetyltransferase [Thermoplasmatota archaeon]
MKAIVLAAGKSSRMAPLATSTAKPLVPVAGRSLLWRTLDSLLAVGMEGAVVVVGHRAPLVARHAKAWPGARAMPVEVASQKRPLGTADAVCAAGVKGDALVVMADSLVEVAALAALRDARGFAVAAARVEDTLRYGRLGTRGRRVTGIVEKGRGGPGWANTGSYRVPAAALRDAKTVRPSPRGELEFTDVVSVWARRGRVELVEASEWVDVGYPWDLLPATARLLPPTLDLLLEGQSTGGLGEIEEGVQVRGRLFVAAGAIVKSGVYVEGDVWVGPGSRVGPNAYLRGPTVVGAGCHVGAGSEVKASVLLDGANAPHLNYVGDSVLGEGCNLGAGTVLANLKHSQRAVRVLHRGVVVDTGRKKLGAIVGDGAKTGVNCSLDPGTLMEAGSWLGAGQAATGAVALRPSRPTKGTP